MMFLPDGRVLIMDNELYRKIKEKALMGSDELNGFSMAQSDESDESLVDSKVDHRDEA